MHVHLHERRISNASETVNLACFDYENIASTTFELFAFDDPQSKTFANKLHFVVGVPMRTRAATGKRIQQKDGDIHVAVLCADELM